MTQIDGLVYGEPTPYSDKLAAARQYLADRQLKPVPIGRCYIPRTNYTVTQDMARVQTLLLRSKR